MPAHWFKIYIMPGLIFQSVVIAGGYATGRELVEFFLSLGPAGGLLGMLVATVIWSLVLAVSFEFARTTQSYDYRSFFQHLLGRGWFLFEIAYFAMMLLVLAVVAAAAGAMMENTFGIPAMTGTLILMSAIGILTFYGSDLIEKFLSGWSFLLYGIYVVFLVWGISAFGDNIAENFAASEIQGGWLSGGIAYAGYNLAVIPAILFCIDHIKKRRQALISGGLAGLLAIVPGVLFYCVMVGMYPAITAEQVPVNTILSAFGARWFELLFQVVIFGTFIETGTGLLHSINQRVAHTVEEKGGTLPGYARPLIALGALILAIVVGNGLGLVNLIARGYGWLTWAFVIIYVLPVLTLGVFKILRSPPRTA